MYTLHIIDFLMHCIINGDCAKLFELIPNLSDEENQ